MFAAMLAFRLAVGGGEAVVEDTDAPVTTYVARHDYALVSPQWIRHRVTPGEHVIDIAARFGVTTDELTRWNDLDARASRLRTGSKLRVHARRLPPARERTTYVVRDGDTWLEIAIAHGVDRRKLQAYNWKTRRLSPDEELTIWLDPGQPRTVNGRRGPTPPKAFDVPPGGRSVGRPQVGRLVDGVQLRDNELFSVRHPRWSWASTHTALQIHRAIADFRHGTGYDRTIQIGSVSLRHGRRFPPHRSHQSGRDADIRLPLRPGASVRTDPRAEEIDWPATWELIRALIDTGEVAAIFLERRLHRRLYQAGREQGASHQDLVDLIQWVAGRRQKRAVIRHSDGHDGHIHVRFECGPNEARCRG